MPLNNNDFSSDFELMTGHPPFPWQRALFERFTAGEVCTRFPPVCDLPTGLGKTSVIAVWVLALAHHARAATVREFPRRLVYVVNRRTVVDQSTREVENVRRALQADSRLHHVASALQGLASDPSGSFVAISTLRGQFADNAEWRNDPAQPAVVVGTVDMIGSRLLFSGYGRGFKSRPLHAAFLGQDVLIVHDEAHLEPAFQSLLEAVVVEQARSREFKHLSLMALSATSRTEAAAFGLTPEDHLHPIVKERIYAKKGIAFHAAGDGRKIADDVAALALRDELRNGGGAILVFLRAVEDVIRVAEKLRKEGSQVRILTGTLRGLERDQLATKDPIFARFMPGASVEASAGTVYLVCTSAGEVGVNISADHLVCDLTSFDGMAQRLGRVNRFGTGDALIDVVVEPGLVGLATSDESESDPLHVARERTLGLLRRLPIREDGRYDAAPARLGALPPEEKAAAFAPAPEILPVGDILFDSWALTTIRGELPGRPMIAAWLHGVSKWEPPETQVAWREEVERLDETMRERHRPEELLEDYPLKPHELLRDRSSRVFSELKKLAEKHPASTVWILDGNGVVSDSKLSDLMAAGQEAIERSTVLLPPSVGGLHDGNLNGNVPFDERTRHDVADLWGDVMGVRRRVRVWDGDDSGPLRGMRLVRTIDIREGEELVSVVDQEPPALRFWKWYVRPIYADDDGSRTARREQLLSEHLESAARFAFAIAGKLLDEPERSAVILAAKWHDLGKSRRIWQRSIGNPNPARILAKSGPGMRPVDITEYRHEFGSLLDLQRRDDFLHLDWAVRDLLLHLVAAHHGRARPHFPDHEVFDPHYTESSAVELAREVPLRFARLQGKYGRWGLAYLESLVRAADSLASQSIEPEEIGEPSAGEAAE